MTARDEPIVFLSPFEKWLRVKKNSLNPGDWAGGPVNDGSFAFESFDVLKGGLLIFY